MLDLLLIYPPISLDTRYGQKKLGNIGGHLPPIGLAYLAAYIRNYDFSVDIIDSPIYNYDTNKLLYIIGELQPKVIGISVITPTYNVSVQLVDMISKKYPDILIIGGGHHVTIMKEKITAFDINVYGEGEITLLDIMNKYKSSNYNKYDFLNNTRLINNIKGITFYKNNDIISTPPRKHIDTLDSLPKPAYDLLPFNKYLPLPNQYRKKPVLHLVISRGCYHNCTFCSNNSVFGNKVRMLSPKKVVDIIEFYIETKKIKEISFWDDNITSDTKWTIEFCELLIRKKLDIVWNCYSRIDTITENLIKKMKLAGCWNIFLGVESGTQKLLDNINKKTKIDTIKNAFKIIHKYNIQIRASVMLGLPGETPELAKDTIRFVIELDPAFAQFSYTTPYPGTDLYINHQKFGTLISKNWDDYNMWQPVFLPYGYKNLQELVDMEKYAMKRFYFRFRYIVKYLKQIRSIEDIRRLIKGMRGIIGFISVD